MKKEFRDLLKLCQANGIEVTFASNSTLFDYAGMNPEASKLMDFNHIMGVTKDEVILDKNRSQYRQFRDLKHELNEWNRMNHGWKYGPAHLDSLKAERRPLSSKVVTSIAASLARH